MSETNSNPKPDIFVLTDYTKSIYPKMLKYAERCDKKPPETNAVTYVNQIIDTVFSQTNHKQLLALLNTRKENGFTALDYYFRKLINQEN